MDNGIVLFILIVGGFAVWAVANRRARQARARQAERNRDTQAWMLGRDDRDDDF